MSRNRVFFLYKKGEQNFVPDMKKCGLYQDIEATLYRLTLNVNSLLLNMNNNLAEHYNSLVCKFVGGKRVNYSLRGSYQTRCEAASILFNAGTDYHELLQEDQSVFTKRYALKLKRKRQMLEKNKRKRGKFTAKRKLLHFQTQIMVSQKRLSCYHLKSIKFKKSSSVTP